MSPQPNPVDAESMTSDKITTETSSSFELESQTSYCNSSHVQPTQLSSIASAPSPSGLRARMSRSGFWKPSSQTTEDAVMGTSDGMTVPFALTASLAGIVPNARYVMLAGLAELTAGAISMALGGLLQARCEAETYTATVKRTKEQIQASKAEVPTIIDDLYTSYNFAPDTLALIKRDLKIAPLSQQTDFIVRHHHGLSPPDSSRPFKSTSTLGSCYFLAGLIGLLPYICVQRDDIKTALAASIAIEAVALFVFGWVKTGVNVGWRAWRKNSVGALMMVAVGAVAAGIAVGLITAVNHGERISM